jgi:RimJ/RimL family protein N-acetyltransferase
MRLWGDPLVTRLVDSRGQLTEEQVRDRLLREIAIRQESGVQYWPVFLLDSASFIGCCGLRPYHRAERVLEFGVLLCAAAWGKGYATEFGRAVLRHAFVTLDVPALFAGHHPENQASRHMLNKLGFRYTHDELYPPTGLMHPSYRIERRDWEARASE